MSSQVKGNAEPTRERTARLGDKPNTTETAVADYVLASAVLNATEALVAVANRSGEHLWFNPAFERLSGYSFVDLQGMRVWDLPFFSEEQRARLHYGLTVASRADFPNELETELIHKNGSQHLISWINTVLLDEEGDIEYFVSIGTDVTARRQWELALHHSQQFTQSVLDSMPATVAVIDKQGIVLTVNGSWRRFGLANGADAVTCDGVGINYLDTCRHAVGHDALWGHQAYKGLKAVLEQETDQFIFEYPCHSPDEKRWFAMRATPLRGGGGAVVAHVDVTDRKMAENALRQNEARLEAVISSASDAIITVDEKQRIVLFNRAAERIFGYSAHEVTGQPIGTLLPEELRTTHSDHIRRFSAEGERGRMMAAPDGGYARRADGTHFPIEAVVSRVNVEGQPLYSVILRDITDRKRAETEREQLFAEISRQRTKLRQLAQEVVLAQEEERGRVSRELHDEAGQALTALKYGLSTLLSELDTANEPLPKARLHQKLAQAMHLCETTMSQIRLLAHDLRPTTLDNVGLNLTLEGFCHDFAERADIAIDYIGCDVLSLGNALDIALYRFLQESLTNVAKHARAEHVAVTLNVDRQAASLSVEDDGIGFDVQEVLWRTDRLRGIGLLGMQERIESLGGHLEIDSGHGHGTLVVAHVPRRRS